MRILLIEDDAHQRLLLAEELGDEGYEVCAAGSGGEALERYDSIEPDLVIADLKLPDMDGTRVVHEIRRRSPKLPIIVSSGYEPGADPSARGPWDLRVLKSSDLTDLKSAVRTLLERREKGGT